MRYALVLAVPMLAQLAVAQGTARLEGRVLSTAGEPINKAEVRLQMPTRGVPFDKTPVLVELSDASGRYAFSDLPPGVYLLSSEKPGYANGAVRSAGGSFFSSVTLRAGDVMRGIDIQMKPRTVITGRVVDGDGDPVVRARVRVVSRGYGPDGLRLTPRETTQTDDRGVYRLVDLAEGRYFLEAEDERAARAASPLIIPGASARDLNVTTYYPSEVDARRAALLVVRLGTELTGIDIQMRRGRLSSVRGMALDASGQPARTPLLVTSAIPTVAPAVRLEPDEGKFEVRLPPGQYILQPELARNGPPTESGRLEFTVAGSDLDGLMLRLVPTLEIPGRMSVDGGSNPLPFGPLPNGVILTPLDGATANLGFTRVDPDGTFQIRGAPAARYVLSMNTYGGAYVRSVRRGNRDTTFQPLDLRDGRADPIEMVVGMDTAEVVGVVRGAGGELRPGVMVALWPDTPRAVLVGAGSRVVSTTTGEFKITGMAPGTYHVAAFERIEPSFVSSYELLRRFNSVATTVVLRSGAPQTVNPILISNEAMAAEESQLR